MLTLIDGNSLLFRAYYGVHSRLTRSDGTPTGAVYGFINMILPILSAARPDDSFVCVFDASRTTFRTEIYPAYKANRSETPADLITQSYMVRDAVAAMGIPVLCIPGVEADDVIATLAKNNCVGTNTTRIITSDKDLMQLVSTCTYLYDGMKGRDIREPQVLEKFGVTPSQVIDVQSLMGDSSDNVPGVPGIGPKKAAELINKFESLDNLYEHLDDVANERIRNLLRDNRDMAFLSRKLVTLRDDVNLDGLEIKPFVFNTRATLEYVKTKLESNSIATKIAKTFPENNTAPEFEFAGNNCPVPTENESDAIQKIESPHPTTFAKPTFETIRTPDELRTFLGTVKNILAIDTETTGLNTTNAQIVGISLAADGTHGVYIPINHNAPGGDLFAPITRAPNQMDIQTVHDILMPVLTDAKITKVGHNLKYDFHILENAGWNTDAIRPFDDTMLISYVLHGTTHGHGMDELALRYMGHENIRFATLFPPKTRDCDMHFDMLDIDVATPYAAEDAAVTAALYNLMRPELDADKTLAKLYDECDRPLMPILMHMERNGVLVNRAGLNMLSSAFHGELEKLSSEIWASAGHEFNIASPKQLGIVLFDELGLPANKKRSTDVDALNDLRDAHEIIDKILNWRTISKLANTYTDALPHQIASDGRIHTTYLQTSTNTGRLSSREPNLQNIPTKTDLGAEIRKCFVAPAGRKLIAVDYSQIQLRLLADIADVKTFKETFHNGADIHEQTARHVFDIPADAPVPRDLRRAAKTVNFSIIYGISSFGLAAQLGMPRSDAQDIINSYMARLPEVKEYIERTKEFATKHGYVTTPWGRRIELPEIKNPRMRAYAMRAAINAPIQGFEADIMRRAMINIDRDILRENGDKIRLIMQVHDEIIFECDAAMADAFAERIKIGMENAAKISVPLVAEYVIGDYWGK